MSNDQAGVRVLLAFVSGPKGTKYALYSGDPLWHDTIVSIWNRRTSAVSTNASKNAHVFRSGIYLTECSNVVGELELAILSFRNGILTWENASVDTVVNSLNMEFRSMNTLVAIVF